jgi:hypothetical protein
MQLETLFTTPRSKTYLTSLNLERSSAVLKSCRAQGIAFGSTVMPLCQVARAQVLHRRRHTIPPDEWESRTREPMYYYGPVSLRNMMPEEWKKKGGATEFFLYIGGLECTLPRMPSCASSTDSGHDKLLSRASFRNRCLSAQRQTAEFINHPLFHEMVSAPYIARLENRKRAVKLWEKNQKGDVTQQDLEELAGYLGAFPYVFANGASSIGSVSTHNFLS